MSYTISKEFALGANEGSSQKTRGGMIMFHSTANVGASARNNAIYEKNNWDGGSRGANYSAYVAYIAGDGVVYQVGEPGYVQWGAGPTANAIAPVQIEMEESADSAKQLRIYNTTIELIRDMCKKWGVAYTFEANSYTGVQTHRHVAQMNGETDHTDPWSPLARIGKTKAQVAADIAHGAGKVKTTAAKASTPAKKPATAKKAVSVNVVYAFHALGGDWLDDVTNFSAKDSGYAGTPYGKFDLLTVKVSHGSVKYRVHELGKMPNDWEAWVYKSDKGDTVNGCAGEVGAIIDGIQVYYTTPENEDYRQAYYRVQTTHRAGWLNVVCDDNSFAGEYGEPIDHFQLAVRPSNPF